MTTALSKLEFNMRLVRFGICWECAVRLDSTSDEPNWLECPTCHKKWRIDGDTIEELIPVPVEVVGKEAGIIFRPGTILVWDLDQIAQREMTVELNDDRRIPAGSWVEGHFQVPA